MWEKTQLFMPTTWADYTWNLNIFVFPNLTKSSTSFLLGQYAHSPAEDITEDHTN